MPLPEMEILVFDEQKPRWWVRRCERTFSVYNISKQQRVPLAFAYLNDVGDTWFQVGFGIGMAVNGHNLQKTYAKDLETEV